MLGKGRDAVAVLASSRGGVRRLYIGGVSPCAYPVLRTCMVHVWFLLVQIWYNTVPIQFLHLHTT
jgi:hypothetical protein